MRGLVLALLALLSVAASAQIGGRAGPGIIRVQLMTSEGTILLALDGRRAPRTTANFLAYVDDGRFDGTFFYRAARKKTAPGQGFVQGGIAMDARRLLPPFPLETTDRTGIRHRDATISMARSLLPDSAGGNFVLTVGPAPAMDAHPGNPGYAAFGRVIAGMATVRRILAQPTGGGMDEMKGQMILRPVRLVSARRIDGVAHPTGHPRPWLLGLRP